MGSCDRARAVLLAGGFGKRIRAVAADLPKPLIPINGRPVIFRQIDVLLRQGVGDIVVVGGYLGDVLERELAREFGEKARVVIESEPLGTGGALSLARPADRAIGTFVISGDLLFDMDLGRLLKAHRDRKAVITLTAHPNAHPRDSDLIAVDQATGRVKALLLRPHKPGLRYANVVNASVAVVSASVWDDIPDGVALNFEKDLVAGAIAKGEPVAAYLTSEYIKDMGTPDRLERAASDLKNGVVAARSLSNKQRAIFLDRDGVLNKHKDHILAPDQIELELGVVDAMRRVNKSPYLAIVVTNQPQIAKGFCSYDDIVEINKELETKLGDEGVWIDDLFLCPHHPDKGFAGEIPAYKISCECRKPGIGMIKAAAEKYNIDLSKSYIVGDSTSDIQAGKAAGLKTVLVQTGLQGRDGKHAVAADRVSANLAAAVDAILAEKT